MEITIEEELLIQQALAIAILAIEQAPDLDKARSSYLLHGDPAAMKKLLEKYVGEGWTLAEVTKQRGESSGLMTGKVTKTEYNDGARQHGAMGRQDRD